MAADKLVDSTQLDSDLSTIANAIRTKSGTSEQLVFPSGFVSAINDIPSGGGDFETGTLTGTGTATSAYITIPVSKQCSHFVLIPSSAVDSWASNEVTGCYAHQSYYFCTSYYSNVRMTASIDTRNNAYVRFRESDIQVLFATNGSYRPLKTIEYKWIAW